MEEYHFSPNKLVFIYSFLKGSFSPNSNIQILKQILMCICTVFVHGRNNKQYLSGNRIFARRKNINKK